MSRRQVAESRQQLRREDTIRARRGRTYLVGARWRAGRGAAGKAGHDARKKRRLAAAARHTYRDGTPPSFTNTYQVGPELTINIKFTAGDHHKLQQRAALYLQEFKHRSK